MKNQKIENLNVIKLYKKKYFNFLPKGSYLRSTFSVFNIYDKFYKT